MTICNANHANRPYFFISGVKSAYFRAQHRGKTNRNTYYIKNTKQNRMIDLKLKEVDINVKF